MKNGLKFKLLFRICLMMIIVSVTCGSLMYYVYSSMLIEESINDSGARMDRLSITLDNSFDDMFQFSNYLSSNATIQDYLKPKNLTPQQKVLSIYDMSIYLNSSLFIKHYIHSLALINSDGDILWTLSPYDNYFGEKVKNELYPNTDLFDVKGFTKEYKLPMKHQSSVTADVISYFSDINIINYKSGLRGKLIINFDISLFLGNISSYSNDFENIGIYDQYGELVFYKNKDASIDLKDSDGNLLSSGKTKGGYRFVNVVPKSNWTIVSFIDQGSLLKKMSFTTSIILMASFLLGILLISLLILPKILTTVKQIIKLNSGMKDVSKGKLDTSISLSGAREFTELSDGFNHMTTEINRYMTESIKHLEEKQHISFELLFAQFNPHFIYNTLNSVIYLARQKKDEDIIEMVSSFIFLLQDAIHSSGGNIFNSLEDELSTVNKYITIQKYRYINRFDIDITLDDALRNKMIPKSVLQPLVENSIIHGICPAVKKGKITLSITEADNDRMRIQVKDNGIGMDQELIDKISHQGEQFNADGSSSMLRSIGLGNVIKELRFLYQDNYDFHIESKIGEGTSITITLPRNPPPTLYHY